MGTRGGQAGFTLIELLTVLVILSILMAFLVPRLAGAGDAAKQKLTRAYLVQLEAAASEYELEFGDYPPSQFEAVWGQAPNLTNMGAETFLAALFSDQWDPPNLAEDKLINMDGDAARKTITGLGTRDLFEFSDEWGNPIAYFHRRDYGRSDTYLSYDNETGELLESSVRSLDNPLTRGPYKRRSFQLISPGLDGRFGTPDDICNFERDQE
ncbi:MAG: prepilin-type N-terminal cleavage/methylation domain-containing protein [Planctomycetota bacterium]|jgi:prepilin-type N-terminal cleavage/methylation domain-containing protein|nr:prepilin-type N-terminal cleavage/methylation domain-containing protein [Planctomycetota bacterium]MDP6839786.1 prepilin-type N-terminal cleavage/methylation domain-containing protein [Planctomycetota bacterium]MDP6955341.1 prepilin-type N-terminal cleavage/methylation domain-containing protein [Planctomycetota bacterium]